MSNTLRRLREVFEDELLVRTPQGMQLTPRALELAEPVSRILRQIERVLEPDRSFDPQHARRVFRIRMSDVLATLVLPRIDRDLHLSNTGISLDIVHLSPEATVDMLERDELDLAVSFALSHGTTIYSEPLMPDRMICAMCRTHPLAGSPISIEQFLAYRHVKISISPTDMRFVDDIWHTSIAEERDPMRARPVQENGRELGVEFLAVRRVLGGRLEAHVVQTDM